jgi:hypothetical protein
MVHIYHPPGYVINKLFFVVNSEEDVIKTTLPVFAWRNQCKPTITSIKTASHIDTGALLLRNKRGYCSAEIFNWRVGPFIHMFLCGWCSGESLLSVTCPGESSSVTCPGESLSSVTRSFTRPPFPTSDSSVE